MSKNRCLRCNRELKDPNARYGWRCAEILGVDETLNYAGNGTYGAYLDGIRAAEVYLKEQGIDKGSINLAKFYEAMAKRSIADSMDDFELIRAAAQELYEALGLSGYGKKGKTYTLAEYIEAKDCFDYDQGAYITSGYLSDEFHPIVADIQHSLSQMGAADKFGNPIRIDGRFGPRTQWAVDRLLGEGERKKWEEVRSGLKEILSRQYPQSNPLVAGLADGRLDYALNLINTGRDTIRAAAKEFNLPPEMVGSVILKELYTQSAPDGIANILTAMDEAMPFIREGASAIGDRLPVASQLTGMIESALKEHSMGPGAIFPSTARPAWESYLGKEGAGALLPPTDLELQYRLSDDPAFNIWTIGAVLRHKAKALGYDLSELRKEQLTDEALEEILARYDAGKLNIDGITYAKRTREYFPYIKILLEP